MAIPPIGAGGAPTGAAPATGKDLTQLGTEAARTDLANDPDSLAGLVQARLSHDTHSSALDVFLNAPGNEEKLPGVRAERSLLTQIYGEGSPEVTAFDNAVMLEVGAISLSATLHPDAPTTTQAPSASLFELAVHGMLDPTVMNALHAKDEAARDIK